MFLGGNHSKRTSVQIPAFALLVIFSLYFIAFSAVSGQAAGVKMGDGKEKCKKGIRKMEFCGVADYIRLCVGMQKSIILTFTQRFGGHSVLNLELSIRKRFNHNSRQASGLSGSSPRCVISYPLMKALTAAF